MKLMNEKEVIKMLECVRDYILEEAEKEGLPWDDWCSKSIPHNYEKD